MNGMAILESPEFQQALSQILAEQVMRIKLRSDIAANWTDADPVLHKAEIGIEEDTGHLKVGDGEKGWEDLDYMGNAVWGTPASATAPGKRGMLKFDANYMYLCVGDNTWRRVAHATWS